MKRLKGKNGFTLVECVVAMTVLAIMSLLLTMILSATLKVRNTNMQLEKEIDQQVENLASGDGAVKESFDKGIDFKDFTIPGNTAENVTANKTSGEQNGLSKLEFDFNNYFDAMGDPPKLGSDKNDEKIEVGDWEKTAPCFGKLDLKSGSAGWIWINETKTFDETAKMYDITWRVSFTVNSYTAVDSLKLTLPVGSKFKGWSTPSGVEKKRFDEGNLIGYTRKITQYILMIQPNASYADTGTGGEQYVEVNLNFTISEEDYKNNYKNLSNYFNFGDFPDKTSINILKLENN